MFNVYAIVCSVRFSTFSIIITIMQYTHTHTIIHLLLQSIEIATAALAAAAAAAIPHRHRKTAIVFNLMIQSQFDMLTSFKMSGQIVAAAAGGAAVVVVDDVRALVESWRQRYYHCFTHTHAHCDERRKGNKQKKKRTTIPSTAHSLTRSGTPVCLPKKLSPYLLTLCGVCARVCACACACMFMVMRERAFVAVHNS